MYNTDHEPSLHVIPLHLRRTALTSTSSLSLSQPRHVSPSKMPPFIGSFWSLLLSAVYWAVFPLIQFLCQTAFKFTGSQLSELQQPPAKDLPKSNGPSGYADTCLTIQYQTGLDIIGVGTAGQVYNVDDIVLKTCRIYEPLSQNATPIALWDYASETIFHFGLLKDERAILRRLAERPHPNIVEVLDSDRILWYQDLIRALLHLHTLRVTHSDIRVDNIFFDPHGHAVLSDFGSSWPFGYPNPSLPVLMNGPAETVSDATDRFAMASMIYELETGLRPNVLSADAGEGLILPVIQTGNHRLDSLIENAWHGRFDSVVAMLQHVESLNDDDDGEDHRQTAVDRASSSKLRERISSWRTRRVAQYGYVLFALPTERQIHILAERYGWRPDDERRFAFQDD
ncbi:Protein kinase-like domain protein [Aspergillus affinis]|uniref:Protein kinase-like domain protein n=1 Tax=Aspergillus affinis TaxID=1070780 RepID=UPI0022FF40DC|nr:Protein kinase-like domain protein [Aspergillus affinis]KAI9045904.1 Protein kinase-like domain protein [Aspergillus affinis]